MEKNNSSNVEKMFFVYESILLLEKEQGHRVFIDSLKKLVTSKRRLNKELNMNIKISERKFKEVLNWLIAAGVIFIPRKGFVQRIFTFRWEEVKDNVKAAKKEQKR